MYVYINGEIKEAGDARLSVFEHGFMYGLGLFETFRIYNGHPFLLDDHFRRMEKGLSLMNIEWKYKRKEVKQQLNDLLEANQWKNAYVRYNISAGTGELGLTTKSYQSPAIIIYMKPLPEAGESRPAEKQGQLLTVRRNSPEASTRLKSHHYFNSILGKREAGDDFSIEGLFVNEQGDLAEGVVSNLFWVKGTTIYTPSVQTGILNGITRTFVINLARKHSYYIREGRFKPAMLFDADEVFITNSIQEVVRLKAVDQYTFNYRDQNKGHSVVDFLQNEYIKYRQQLWNSEEIFFEERKKENE
ncbi:aminodeoxychorismate lyase [Alteribacillus sp. YIM 98480]|uniref:aminodeoxychorismate lyase n=1 Tax=Alteribacillus sp. YIM 98480 TaxID=2606599 RepID=UPI00131DC749|nr:aminodeoxychorismate lyase [Alteribacillus sp. YIM 98480]